MFKWFRRWKDLERKLEDLEKRVEALNNKNKEESTGVKYFGQLAEKE